MRQTSDRPSSCPMDSAETVRRYFIENRSRLIDIAAYLDRVDRSGNPEAGREDFRLRAFRRALEELVRSEAPGQASRVERIQTLLSDPTLEPLESLDQKSASGAFGGTAAKDSNCC